MSEVFGFCKAGCKYPVVKEDDFLKVVNNISPLIELKLENSMYYLEMGKKYKLVRKDTTADKWNVSVMILYTLNGSGKVLTLDIDKVITTPKFVESITFELLGVEQMSTYLRYHYAINGTIATIDTEVSTGTFAHGQDGKDAAIFEMSGYEKLAKVYEYNENEVEVKVSGGGSELVAVEVGDIATFNLEQYNQMRAVLDSGKQLVAVEAQTDHYVPIAWNEMSITFAGDEGYVLWDYENQDACEWKEWTKTIEIDDYDIGLFEQNYFNIVANNFNKHRILFNEHGEHYYTCVSYDTTQAVFTDGISYVVWDNVNKTATRYEYATK